MELVEIIVFYVLLIDSIGCNIVAWGKEGKWYRKNFRIISRNFPATKGWATYYLILVLWIGIILWSSGTAGF